MRRRICNSNSDAVCTDIMAGTTSPISLLHVVVVALVAAAAGFGGAWMLLARPQNTVTASAPAPTPAPSVDAAWTARRRPSIMNG